MAKPASQIRSTFGAIKPPFHLVMQPSRDHEQCPAVLWPKRVMLCSIYKSCNVWFKGRVPKIRPWRMTPSDLYAVYTTTGNWPNRPWFDRFWIGSSLWSHQSLLCSQKYMVNMPDSGLCTISDKNGSRCIWLYTKSTNNCRCPHTKGLIHGPPYWMVSIWSIEINSTALVTWYTLPSLTRAKIVPAVSQHAAPSRLLLICIAFCGMSF